MSYKLIIINNFKFEYTKSILIALLGLSLLNAKQTYQQIISR